MDTLEKIMSETTIDQNLQRAIAFCRGAGLTRLLLDMRQKYIELGQVGGSIVLHDSTALERREIASFLARPPYPLEKPLRVRLIDFEKALLHSFGCDLPALLTAFFPEQSLITRASLRETRASLQARFYAQLHAIVTAQSSGSRGRSWLEGEHAGHEGHGEAWLYARYKNAPEEEQERQLALVYYIASILDHLPPSDQPERLALFAQRTSGDPHALDANRAAGRLFLLALNDLAGTTMGTTLRGRELELQLYTGAGLLVDTISSSVAVFNLDGAFDASGRPDSLLQEAGKRVLLLPLRQLFAWERVLASCPAVYVFENPQVFEAVIAALDLTMPLPTLICTSGWPSVAAMTLLDRLVTEPEKVHLHYSGDFDLKGLQIAAHLLARYPGRCHPWHFDLEAYTLALQSDGIPARPNDLNLLNALPETFAPLISAMQEQQKWAYQEGITPLLAADIQSLH
jgi:uncharacterized protein (TIGR02679 family)